MGRHGRAREANLIVRCQSRGTVLINGALMLRPSIWSQPSSGLGKLPLELRNQPGPPVSVSLTVVPGLPLLRAVLRLAGRGPINSGNNNNNPPLAVAPHDEELASVPSAVAAMAAAAAAVASAPPRGGGLGFGATGSRSAGSGGSRGMSPPPVGGGGVVSPGSPPPSSVFSPVGPSGGGSIGPVTVWQGQVCCDILDRLTD